MSSPMACVVPPPMTTPTERAQVYFANALLPAPLPTPPRSKMLPLLPTPPCLVLLLPTSPPKPKPGRADAAERWDARKNVAVNTPPCKPGRADAVERWDAHKTNKPALSATSSSSSSTSSSCSLAFSSSQKCNSNKKRAVSRAESAERWDAQKKQPRPPQAREPDDDDKRSTGSNDVELDTPPRQALYAGPDFIVSPQPGMLPMPSFKVRVA